MERYHLLEKVGDGTYGSVWKGANKENNNLVAIKRLKMEYDSWENCVNLREIETLRSISSHDNIVEVKELIREEDSTLHFIFEYMPDGHLHQLVKNIAFEKTRIRTDFATQTKLPYYHESNWTPDKMLAIIKQVLSGLKHMHAHGFVHRDIKPENLLLRGDHCKIADFGLSRRALSSSSVNNNDRRPLTEYISTRWYRAPEVLLRSSKYGPPIDIFATGCVLVELLTLKPLLPGSGEIDQIYQVFSLLGFPSENNWREGLQLMLNPKLSQVPFEPHFVHHHMSDTSSSILQTNYHTSHHNGTILGINANNNNNKRSGGLSLDSMRARRRLEHIMPTIDADIISFIHKMLCLDPNDRPSARKLLKDPCFEEQQEINEECTNSNDQQNNSQAPSARRSPMHSSSRFTTPALEIENTKSGSNSCANTTTLNVAPDPTAVSTKACYPVSGRLTRKRRYIQSAIPSRQQQQQQHQEESDSSVLGLDVSPVLANAEMAVPIQQAVHQGMPNIGFAPQGNVNASFVPNYSVLPTFSGFGKAKFRLNANRSR